MFCREDVKNYVSKYMSHPRRTVFPVKCVFVFLEEYPRYRSEEFRHIVGELGIVLLHRGVLRFKKLFWGMYDKVKKPYRVMRNLALALYFLGYSFGVQHAEMLHERWMRRYFAKLLGLRRVRNIHRHMREKLIKVLGLEDERELRIWICFMKILMELSGRCFLLRYISLDEALTLFHQLKQYLLLRFRGLKRVKCGQSIFRELAVRVISRAIGFRGLLYFKSVRYSPGILYADGVEHSYITLRLFRRFFRDELSERYDLGRLRPNSYIRSIISLALHIAPIMITAW